MPHQHHAMHQHVHARVMHLEPRDDPATVVQVIYKTADKTFDGPIGGYMTLDGSDNNNNNNVAATPQTQAAPQVQPAASPKEQATQASQAPVPVQNTQPSQVATTPTPQVQAPAPTVQDPTPSSQTPVAAPVASTEKARAKEVPTSTTRSAADKPTSVAKKPIQESSSVASQASSQITGATPTGENASASSSSVTQNAAAAAGGSATSIPNASHQSSGMSGGAKAGLAIGILLAIGLVAGLIFFCYRRKKKSQQEKYVQADDEKSIPRDGGGAAALNRAASTRTNATAPRLSLRPVTQFLPDLAGRRKSGNALATTDHRNLAPADAMTEKQPVHTQPSNSGNPFTDHAEPSEKTFAPREERSMIPNQANNPTNPFGNHAETVDRPAGPDHSLPTDTAVPAPLRIRTPTPEGNASTAVTAGAAGAALAAAGLAGQKHGAPKPLDISPNRAASPAPMPSPSGTEFSMTSVTPAAMTNGPPPSNVHRVQLDFKPSMEDELGLRAGQLVRLLHEYDDGWALCIRLDRSQQGVAPRTCLSARPVKPRPNPNARGPGPRGPPPGIFGPGQQRPMSPSSGRGSPSPYDRAPRGMAPGPHSGQRSMSPGPYGGGPQRSNMPAPGTKRRSNSASEVRERRMSPPGPSPMNPNAQNILTGAQKGPMQPQAVATPDQALPSPSPPASMPTRKPVPGQAM
ncbi:MAG: hypothetical protein LQ350_004002 [Teloschistes chrysophthalmus]|nr:MAG: hypothetical protein LQ350_004002 [Niorma chrysophthalma]